MIIGPPDTLYEGGFFKCHLLFPKDYPLKPPELRILTEIWHPNIDKNGKVCISILHEPGKQNIYLLYYPTSLHTKCSKCCSNTYAIPAISIKKTIFGVNSLNEL